MTDTNDTDDDGSGQDDEIAAFTTSGGPSPEDMAGEYLPEQDDWQAKTILDLTDPAAVASLRQMQAMYPEVHDLQPLIDEFLDEFMKTRTSVGGQSREEYRNILMSMFGGGQVDENTARNAVIDAMAQDNE
jgi:hypothetical protein